jgi:hypothetical protein
MNELKKYIEDNPNEKLLTGTTVLNKYYVRPISWYGIWNGAWEDKRLLSGRCLEYFDTKEDLDNTLIRLGYELS